MPRGIKTQVAETSVLQEKNKLIAIVNGLEIRENSLYKVEPKEDLSAPSGFIKEGTKKLPSEGISNLVSCPFSNEKGAYNTGFYLESDCYNNLPKEEVLAKIKNLKTFIVEPYERLKGLDTLRHQNNDFWDSYMVEIEDGKVFNTGDIQDLLGLYVSMLGYSLCPSNEIGNPKFRNADYVIKDANKSMSIKKQRILEEMEAVSSLQALMLEDVSLAIDLLKSLNIVRTSITPDEDDMKIAFDIWSKKDVQNTKIFLRAYEKVKTKQGALDTRLKVRVLSLMSKGAIRRIDSGDYLYDSTPIGIDLISIINNLNTNEEFKDIKEKIMMS
jgi:hypothetical protein